MKMVMVVQSPSSSLSWTSSAQVLSSLNRQASQSLSQQGLRQFPAWQVGQQGGPGECTHWAGPVDSPWDQLSASLNQQPTFSPLLQSQFWTQPDILNLMAIWTVQEPFLSVPLLQSEAVCAESEPVASDPLPIPS